MIISGTPCTLLGPEVDMLPIQNFSSGVLAEIIRRQPPSAARTRFAWQLAVGPALARATVVDLADGVLSVKAVDRRWLREIDRERARITARMQELLGLQAVTRVETGWGPEIKRSRDQESDHKR